MAQECKHLPTCGFFKKYCTTKNLACRGFIAQYCKGPAMNVCKRKAYKAEYGQAPPDDMMPTGQMIASAVAS